MNPGQRWKVYRSTYLFREEREAVWIAKRIDGGESRPFNNWEDALSWANQRIGWLAQDAIKRYNLEKIVAQSSRDRLHHNHCPDCRCC
jgi:hypothetical protein